MQIPLVQQELRNEKIGVKTLTRSFSKEIKPLGTNAIWFKIQDAAHESGLSIKSIKAAGILIRRFGRADYVKTEHFNKWIEGEES
jgi:hypothetical protein